MPNENPPHISPSDLPPKRDEPSKRKREARKDAKPAKPAKNAKPSKRQKSQRIPQQPTKQPAQAPQPTQQPQQVQQSQQSAQPAEKAKAPVQPQHRAPASQQQPQAKKPARQARQSSSAPKNKQQQSAQRKSAPKKQADTNQQKTPRKGMRIVFIVLLVAVLAGVAFLVWDYLFRYDDAKDIQGQWKIEGTTSSIVITPDEIRLTESVSFNYELNTFEKTITYGYGSYTGSGTYVFTSDRQVLVITDINPNLGDSDEGESMRLLKVSNQVVGEPENAVNNTTQDANTYGADVVGGDMTATQAYDEDKNPSNIDPDEG